MTLAIYARVSSEDQEQRGTIENQVEFGEKYVDLHQLGLIKWYKDDGVTGTIPLEERPDGARLLEDARAGRIDLLLVYRLDRLGRSARIILNSVYDLEQCGVTIRSMTEPFDTGTPNGRFLLTILAGVADLERETILERMWLGANRRAREGRWLGGIVPYGYVKADKYLEVSAEALPGMDMSEADIIALIYKMTVDRHDSTIKIADYLNLLKVPPSYTINGRQVKQGKRKVNTAGIWRPSRIRNMIVNPTYKGIHVYGKRTKKVRELIEREVPAIVSAETWERAQQVLKENQLESTRNTKYQYLLRGMIKCGICGLTYNGIAYPGPERKKKGYYVCNGKTSYRGPLQGKCTSRNVDQAWIEDLVWKDCLFFIENPGKAMEELTATVNDSKAKIDFKQEKELLTNYLQKLDTEKQNILDLYRKNLISMADVEQQLQKIAKEKESYESKIKELNRQQTLDADTSSYYDNLNILLFNLQKILKGPIVFEDKRMIVRSLVKEIVSHPDEITIKYKFSQGNHRTVERANNTLDGLVLVRVKNMPPPRYAHPPQSPQPHEDSI